MFVAFTSILLITVLVGGLWWFQSYHEMKADHDKEIRDARIEINNLNLKLKLAKSRYSALEKGMDEMEEGYQQMILDYKDQLQELLEQHIENPSRKNTR